MSSAIVHAFPDLRTVFISPQLPDDLKERLQQRMPREELLLAEAEIEQQQKKAKPTLSVMPTFPPCAAMFHAASEASSISEGYASDGGGGGGGGSSGGDSKRVCNRELADLIAESSLRKTAAAQMFVCARCGQRGRLVHRGTQTASPATSPLASSRHVHRAFASATVVSASPYSGAILDV